MDLKLKFRNKITKKKDNDIYSISIGINNNK